MNKSVSSVHAFGD